MDAGNIKEKTGLTPKELALYVGVPVATICVAGGIYYFYTKSSSDDKKPLVEKKKEPQVDETEQTPPVKSVESATNEKNRGNKFFKAGRHKQAIDCYTRAIELCPEGSISEISTFYQNRAAAHEMQKNWHEVIKDCSIAINLNPKYSKALGRRAKAYEVLDEKLNCLEDVTAVCLLEGFQNQNCMFMADRILKAIGKELAEKNFETRPRVLPSPVFVNSYLDSFNKDIFHVELTTEESDSNYAIILQTMKKKEFEKIIELCNKEIERDGAHSKRAHLLRGTMYTLMCNIPLAVKDLDTVINHGQSEENDPLKIDALIKRGSLHMQEAKDKECYADFDMASQIDNSNPNIHQHRGQLYFLTERLEEAKKEFEEAISLDKSFIAPRLQLGYCLCKLAMQTMSVSLMNDANRMLDETTKLFPQSPEAWSLYGQLLQDQQKLDEAVEKLDKAISLAPDNPTTYVYKGLLMLQWKQDVEGANKLIRKALEIDDRCDFAYETLATLEVQKGNNEEAIRLFERALQLVRTESEMANTYSLLEAAKAQAKVTKLYGVTLPTMPMI